MLTDEDRGYQKMGRIKKYLFIFCSFFLNSSAEEFRILDLKQFPEVGMFAATNQVLGQLALYETMGSLMTGLKIDFGSYGLYYDPPHGPNWWEYYFEPICIGEQTPELIRYPSIKQCHEAFGVRRRLKRLEAAHLIQKYIHVKPSIQEKVDLFAAEYFQNFYILAVHYRGTDKRSEAPIVPYSQVIEKVAQSIPKNLPVRIFVATDEAPFLKKMEEAFPGLIVATIAHRTEGRRGIHFINNSPYEVGEEALIDALLLSRSDFLIRTSSNLSLWSTYFNPHIPTLLLNGSYRNRDSADPE